MGGNALKATSPVEHQLAKASSGVSPPTKLLVTANSVSGSGPFEAPRPSIMISARSYRRCQSPTVAMLNGTTNPVIAYVPWGTFVLGKGSSVLSEVSRVVVAIVVSLTSTLVGDEFGASFEAPSLPHAEAIRITTTEVTMRSRTTRLHRKVRALLMG